MKKWKKKATVIFTVVGIVLVFSFGLISAAAIPYNYVEDGGFEKGDLSEWKAENAKMERTTKEKNSGSFSLRVYDRTSEWGQVTLEISNIFEENGKGGEYFFSGFMKATQLSGSPDEKALVRLLIMSNNGGKVDIQNWYNLPEMLPSTNWIDLGSDGSGGFVSFGTSLGNDISWIGDFRSAILIFGIPANTAEFYIDDISFWKVGAEPISSTSSSQSSQLNQSSEAKSEQPGQSSVVMSSQESVGSQSDSASIINSQTSEESSGQSIESVENIESDESSSITSTSDTDGKNNITPIIIICAVIALAVGGFIAIKLLSRKSK